MTQLDQLESEAAVHRARLADAIEGVRASIEDTAADLREKLSPSRAAHRTGENLRKVIAERARSNPVQVISAAAVLAYPAWRIVRRCLCRSSSPEQAYSYQAKFVLARQKRVIFSRMLAQSA